MSRHLPTTGCHTDSAENVWVERDIASVEPVVVVCRKEEPIRWVVQAGVVVQT